MAASTPCKDQTRVFHENDRVGKCWNSIRRNAITKELKESERGVRRERQRELFLVGVRTRVEASGKGRVCILINDSLISTFELSPFPKFSATDDFFHV